MSNNLDLFTLEFGSLLTYSPRGISESERSSKTIMRALKNDSYIGNQPILMSEYISNIIVGKITTLPFSHFFKTDPILVPVPNSSLMQADTLWVPLRLATALHRNRFGIVIKDLLRRHSPLPKSATSLAKDRPTATQHYESLGVRMTLSEPREILLVDDIITRGTTMIGAANKLRNTFPRARIRGFAAMRTISPPDIFHQAYDPCLGIITFNGQDTFRRP